MIKEKKIVSIFFVLLYVLSIFIVNNSFQISSFEEGSLSNKVISDYISHDPIDIHGNDDFETYGFPGNGSKDNPYIIEGLYIEANHAPWVGIKTYSTSKYFIIQNCYIVEGTVGISILTASTNTVKIINNTLVSNFEAVTLQRAESAVVSNNTFINNIVGIRSSECRDSVFSNNTLTSSFFDIYDTSLQNYMSYIIENNSISGSPMLWYETISNVTYSNIVFGQLFLVNCSNLKLLQMTSAYFKGLSFFYCKNISLTESDCLAVAVGSELLNISGNPMSSSYGTINLVECSDCEITQNALDSGSIHIQSSSRIKVEDNICKNGGIRIVYSDNCELTRNLCSNSLWVGISLFLSNQNRIENNTIYKNGELGIRIYDSDFNVFAYNIIEENYWYGIKIIENSEFNIIHHNTFFKNNVNDYFNPTSQAYDECSYNQWYEDSTNEGNYWSDWNGEGSYHIDGSANAEDLYPLNEPSVDPIPEFSSIISLILLVGFLSVVSILTLKLKR